MSDPPAEAYSRVTRDVRALFGPVAAAADQHVERLRRDFDVTVTPLTAGDSRVPPPATRAVLISPADGRAAPLTVGWTDFPGVRLRYGHFGDTVIPGCGCDACAETTEECLDELSQVVTMVTRGFWERVEIGKEVWIRIQEPHGSSGSQVLDAEQADALRVAGSQRMLWAPWPRRGI